MTPTLIKKKICLLGDGAVGKTSLIRRYVDAEFSAEYIQTIGTQVSTKEVAVTQADSEYAVRMMIWDVLGQAQYETVRNTAFLGAKAAILVFDLTRIETLHNLREWAEDLRGIVGDVPMIIFGNKADIAPHSSYYLDALNEVAAEIGAPYFFSSAKTGRGVEEAFTTIANYLVHADGTEPEAGPKAAVRARKRRSTTSVVALDRIMDLYATLHGGQELAMPKVQEAFRAAGLHLDSPQLPAIRQMIDRLVPPPNQGELEDPERLQYLEILSIIEAPDKIKKPLPPPPPSGAPPSEPSPVAQAAISSLVDQLRQAAKAIEEEPHRPVIPSAQDLIELAPEDTVAVPEVHRVTAIIPAVEAAKPTQAAERGHNMLLISNDPDAFFTVLAASAPAFTRTVLMTQVYPPKVRKRPGLEDTVIFWISEMASEEKALNPKRLKFEILKEAGATIKDGPGSLLALEGLEYLILENGFDDVISFLTKVTDAASIQGATVLATIDPDICSQSETSYIRRKFDHILEG